MNGRASIADTARALQAAFIAHYGAAPTLLAQAPGRVNLIGEHTDYNDGFVLPCAIDFATLVALRPRADRLVRVLAVDQNNAVDAFNLDAPIVPRHDASWPNYVRGMLLELQAAHGGLPGADVAISGDVPVGAGLSSSAALEVAIGTAFKALAKWRDPDSTGMALLAQRAENHFVGCRCGVMDQLVSACGVAGHALLIDCRSLQFKPIALPPELAVLIVHSNIRRGLVDSAYNERRAQCEAAAAHYGVAALRDLDETALHARAAGLDPTVWRRARHVVTENRRTLRAADALASMDLPLLGQLMAESHASMRDDFQITTPDIDRLVHIIGAAIGPQGGARMTGGGFGGCVVALASVSSARAAIDAVAEQYRSADGVPATPYLCKAAPGAGVISAAF